MKKNILLVLIICLLHSCQYFEKQVPNKQKLLQQELGKINWTQVDYYPSTPICDTIADKEKQKQCFFNYLTLTIQQKIVSDTLSRLCGTLDTIPIKITVYPDSKLKFEPDFSMLNQDTQKLDSLVQDKLSNFPIIEPAIKRGVKVKAEFILPVPIR